MMKNKLILTTMTALAALAAVYVASPLHAREWTSADGKNTFDGEYVSSTDTTLTVIKGGRKVTFKLTLISDADRTWIKEEQEAVAKAEQEKKEAVSLADTVIGKKLMGKTVRVVGNDYKKQDTQKVPDYYFVYYSASW